MLVARTFSFFRSFFKRLVLQTRKIPGIVWERVKNISRNIFNLINPFPNKPWPHDYKSFFMLISAEREISMLDKSHLINLLEELLIYRKFHCFCLSYQTFKIDFLYTLKHQWDFKVWAQTQLSTDSSFISTGPGFLCVCSTSVLKTHREKEKLLIMSNFSIFP